MKKTPILPILFIITSVLCGLSLSYKPAKKQVNATPIFQETDLIQIEEIVDEPAAVAATEIQETPVFVEPIEAVPAVPAVSEPIATADIKPAPKPQSGASSYYRRRFFWR
jgi:hypothetical protein